MIVPVTLRHPDLLPKYMTPGAVGMDLFAAEDRTIWPSDVSVVPTGVSAAIPWGQEGQVRARSGLSTNHKLVLANGVGTIDSDYRGEIMVPLLNLGDWHYKIRRGDRIAQLVICPVKRVRLRVVETLDDTARGVGGFGSTG